MSRWDSHSHNEERSESVAEEKDYNNKISSGDTDHVKGIVWELLLEEGVQEEVEAAGRATKNC